MEILVIILFVILLVVISNANTANRNHILDLKNEIQALKTKVSLLINELNNEKPTVKDIKKIEFKPIEKIIEVEKVEDKIIETPILPIQKTVVDIDGTNLTEETPPPIPVIEIKKETNIPRVTNQQIQQESWWQKFQKNNPDLEKFIGENLISKIGIVILVLGISFFVKFAIDNDWINEIGRLAIGILSGVLLLGFAHRLQKEYNAFSSILVSGAIVVFYFTIAYGFKQYHTFNQTTAFILMVIITIFSVVISILYNRKELGILSIIGAFAVPLMVSNGDGNYIFLYSYILIIDIGFLIVALNRKWIAVNILAFIFTHIFLFYWIITKDLNVTIANNLLIFSTLFYLCFYSINIIRTLKEETKLSTISFVIFIANTFVFFGQGLYLLIQFHPQYKGLFTILLAAINLITGYYIIRKNVFDKNIVYLFIGLTLTFVTLAGPIQLKGNYITLFWAAETVLLLWLSQKTKNNDFKIGFLIVAHLMLISLILDFNNIYSNPTSIKEIFLTPFLNKGFITGIFCVVCLACSVVLLKKEKEDYQLRFFKFQPSLIATVVTVYAFVVLYFTLLLELKYQTAAYCEVETATILVIIYNLLCINVVIYFFAKFNHEIIKIASVIITVLTTFFVIISLGDISSQAYILSKTNTSTVNYTYWLQLFVFFLILFLLFRMNKSADKYFENNNYIKYFLYFSAFAFTTIISIELTVLLLPHYADNAISKLPATTDLNYEIYTILENVKVNIVKTGFPILWSLIAFGFLFLGIKKSNKEMRIFSLILLTITLVKLFAYDISNVSQAGKIISFIVLGIVLLVISFMYQKIKKVLFEDETTKDDDIIQM